MLRRRPNERGALISCIFPSRRRRSCSVEAGFDSVCSIARCLSILYRVTYWTLNLILKAVSVVLLLHFTLFALSFLLVRLPNGRSSGSLFQYLTGATPFCELCGEREEDSCGAE